jgi:hypothetical protein
MQRSWKNPVSLVRGKEPSKLFDVALDRTDFNWPEWLMPSAPGAVVASKQLVRHATTGCPQISPYRRWHDHENVGFHWIRIETNRSIFLMPVGKWWFIIRDQDSRSHGVRMEILASISGPAPIFAEDVETAKKLAVYYYFLPIEKTDRIFWAACDF